MVSREKSNLEIVFAMISKLKKNKSNYQKRYIGPRHDVRLDLSEQVPIF